MLTTYRRKESVQKSRHDSKSEVLAWPLRSIVAAICFAFILTGCVIIGVLKDSCRVAQSLSAPAGLGFINIARRMQWQSLQRKTTPMDLRRSNKQLLLTLRDIFERYNITYWVADGTLLGAMRNGRMIPHDVDGDMSILKEGWDRLREIDGQIPGGIPVPTNVKLQILNSSRQDRNGVLQSGVMPSKRDAGIPVRAYSEDTGWYIDVGIMVTAFTDDRYRMLREHDSQFPFMSNQTFLQSSAWSTSYQNCMGCMIAEDTSKWFRGVAALRVPQDWILPTASCAFEDERFQCPRNSDAYLAYYYGTHFKNHGDPAPICTRIADVSSLFSSFLRGSREIGWKRDDGSRLGNPENSQATDGSSSEAYASVDSATREHRIDSRNLERFEVTPVGHVMRKQANANQHLIGVSGDDST